MAECWQRDFAPNRSQHRWQAGGEPPLCSSGPAPRSPFPTRVTDVVGIVPEVHQNLVEAERWLAVLVGAWRRSEAIHLLEGRVVLLGLRRALCEVLHCGRGLLSMSDN